MQNNIDWEEAKTPTPFHPIPIDTQMYIKELESRFDRIVEQLETLRIDKHNYFGVLNIVAEKYDRANEMLDDAIEIVRNGGKE